MAKRPDIPSELEQAVLVESGHRCGIPACRQVPVELSHIVPWSRCKEHRFENLIALCPTCHTRFDMGMIDRKAMQAYKFHLSVANGRFGDLEQRVIRSFIADRSLAGFWWFADMAILLQRLLDDGLLHDSGTEKPVGGLIQKRYELTDKGRELIDQWPTT